MAIDKDILMATAGQHPAHTMPFDTLYTELQREVAEGNVSVVKDDRGELELYSYTADCQFDNKWTVYSLIARGLILCPPRKMVVATTFPKFMNWGEVEYAVPDLPFSTTTKIDGSLGIIHYWYDEWQVATRGSFKSEQAQWAKKWLDANVDTSHWFTGDTYLAEIIYSDNRIVIPYDFEGLVLLAVYDNEGYEIGYGEMASLAIQSNMRHTEYRGFSSIDDILKIAESLPHTEEGFVLRFENGYRLKIKGEQYCRVHKLISNVRPLHVWGCLINGDDMDSIYKQLPEELRIDFDNIRRILEDTFESKMKKLAEGYEKTKHLNDKELGLYIIECREQGFVHCDIPSEFVADNLFLCRKKNLLKTVHIMGSKERNRIFKYFRPKNDQLPGYVPTNAMNRFAEDEN